MDAAALLMETAMNKKNFYFPDNKPRIKISAEKLKQVYSLWSKEAEEREQHETDDTKENVEPNDAHKKEDED